MNKDFDLKNERYYNHSHLRGRIQDAIKGLRDETEEVRAPQSKTMPIIPVTGSGKTHKYFDNKLKNDLK